MSDIQQKEYGAGEFLALLLEQVEQLYRDNTDDFASLHALDIAIAVIETDEKLNEKSAETILEEMSGLAEWMLHTPELSPAIRSRLEIIRDTGGFAEPAPESFSIEAMLSDTVLQARLVKWAVAFAHNKLTPARPDVREVAMHACKQVCAIWRQTIFPDVLAQLEAANNKAAAE